MAEANEDSETRKELSLVCQSQIVFSYPGEDVVLSCHLKPAISAVSMEIKWWNKADLVCHYKDEQKIESCEGRVSLSLQDLLNGNVSLTLRDVRISQTGLYICEVIHEYQTIKEYVFLHINSEDFSLVIPHGTVSAGPGSDVILPVHLSPETSAVSMTVRWFRETDLIFQYKNGQEITNNDYGGRVYLSIQELERGNVSLTLRNVQQSESGDYTCRVFYNGCLQTGIVHLQLRGPTPRRRSSMEEIPPLMGDDGTCETPEMRLERVVLQLPTHQESQEPQELQELIWELQELRRELWVLIPALPRLQQILAFLFRVSCRSLRLSLLFTRSVISTFRVFMQRPFYAGQERFSPVIQSQEQEREKTSVTLPARDMTQTPGRPVDRTLRRRERIETNCQIL